MVQTPHFRPLRRRTGLPSDVKPAASGPQPAHADPGSETNCEPSTAATIRTAASSPPAPDDDGPCWSERPTQPGRPCGLTIRGSRARRRPPRLGPILAGYTCRWSQAYVGPVRYVGAGRGCQDDRWDGKPRATCGSSSSRSPTSEATKPPPGSDFVRQMPPVGERLDETLRRGLGSGSEFGARSRETTRRSDASRSTVTEYPARAVFARLGPHGAPGRSRTVRARARSGGGAADAGLRELAAPRCLTKPHHGSRISARP